MLEWNTLPATPDLLGECPTWDDATQTLYWTDIPGMVLKSWHAPSGLHRAWPMPGEVGSFESQFHPGRLGKKRMHSKPGWHRPAILVGDGQAQLQPGIVERDRLRGRERPGPFGIVAAA